MERIYNWMEARKNKIKWKTTNKPFVKDSVMKKNKFWAKFIGFIIFLISAIALMKKFIPYLKKILVCGIYL
jgi:hypothetical protein